MKRECLHPSEITEEVVPTLRMSLSERVAMVATFTLLTLMSSIIVVGAFWLAYDCGRFTGNNEGRAFERGLP